jgi:hypothetical protein
VRESQLEPSLRFSTRPVIIQEIGTRPSGNKSAKLEYRRLARIETSSSIESAVTNPYIPPRIHEFRAGEARREIGSPIALICFGLLPAAIIVVRILDRQIPVRDWDWFYWVWTVAPPLYLTGVWLLAILVQRRSVTALRMLLPVALLPLVLFSMFILGMTVLSLLQPAGYELTGWLAVDHLLWLVVSLIVPLYFLTTTWSALRAHRYPNQTNDEQIGL